MAALRLVTQIQSQMDKMFTGPRSSGDLLNSTDTAREGPRGTGAEGSSLAGGDLAGQPCGSFGQTVPSSVFSLPSFDFRWSFLPPMVSRAPCCPVATQTQISSVSLSPSSQALDGRAMASAVEGRAHHFTVFKSVLDLKASESIS